MILHPLTTLVFWYEFGALAFADQDSALSFIIDRTLSAFAFEMFAMSLIYAAIGGAIGLGFGVYHVRLVHERSRVRFLERELNEELPLLIARGESEQLEFKSSFRWDRRQEKVNRSLQQVIVKTLAGFLNQEGGTLLIGVEDDGSIAGIEADMQTLKPANQDGFERLLMDTAKEGLGGHACALIHCRFHKLEEKIVCRVIVEKSLEPIYFSEGSVARFMLRAGNSTRELDVREAQAYLQHRGKVSI
ncbi:ATP-binding protein [Citromicrobium bathyomarinum]|nr:MULTISPECIES: ATP-binding protein [Sphingomonadales]ASP30556.1 ATP-binding protein [Qipengyuania flava]MAQ28382.1 ATP-binding protein [Erythrobacter sp.]MBO79879.1 ATP-binding protein [Citromicrobium sp.]